MAEPLSINFDLSKLPWPIPGDTLFTEAEDWQYNARLHGSHDKWDAYATGYKEAADILIERVLSDRMWMDMLVYPIVFLYRHYLELRLKELVISGSQLLDEDAGNIHGHSLIYWWKEARKIFEKVWPDDEKADLDSVENCILQFASKDSGSDSFRYPVNTKGEKTLDGLNLLNLRQFKEAMSRVAALLEGASSAILEYRSHVPDEYG